MFIGLMCVSAASISLQASCVHFFGDCILMTKECFINTVYAWGTLFTPTICFVESFHYVFQSYSH